MTDPWHIGGVPVTLKRSARRRTLGLQVRSGAVTLYAPQTVTAPRLERFLLEKRGWMEGHLSRYAARPEAVLRVVDGAALPFLGETLTLRVSDGVRRPRREAEVLHLPAQDAERQMEAWTRAACVAPYRELVAQYARRVGAEERLRRVSLSGAKTRWGSCNSRGDIRLHWKLSRAPLSVLHYVALHEAAHLRELNHSPRYWAHVTRVMPDWARQRDWLRVNGHTL